jgi:hypothetical protein
MTETGFIYFMQALQEFNAGPKKKRKIPRSLPPISPLNSSIVLPVIPPIIPYQPPPPVDDYIGSVCLLHSLTKLFPAYLEVLVDADDMERLLAHKWHLVRSGKDRSLRVMNGRGRFLHTVVMNAPKGNVVDHIFHRPRDNRKSQLRVCTTRENNINIRPRSDAFSKYKGVGQSKKTGKWFVHAGPRSGRVFIGGFDSEIAAARAYNELARSLYSSMAYQNPV